MAWFNRDEDVPEELKGLTPKEIAEAVKGHAALRAELDSAKGQLSEMDALKAQISALEQRPRYEPPQAPPVPRAGPTSFLEDEDAAFNERAAPLTAAVLALGAQQSRFIFQNSISDPLGKSLFTKYGSEVEELMKRESPQVQANPASWSAAFDIIKGRHIGDITKAAQDKSDFFAETASGTMDAGPGRSTLPPDRLTPDEEAVASKYGLKPEEMLASRKEMVTYHG